ncbi:MAG: heme ABC transporter ATP-binding protein [Bacillota bacterium]|nr:heme ABC transporter ATP-binding protein [Bacillota bacterium]
MNAIEISNLNFSFDKPVLNNISLQLRLGAFTGILGPNGAGKSTIVKILSRWFKPQSGTVHIKGQSLPQLSQRQLAQLLAVVEQDTLVGSDITVRELVALGRLPHQSFFAEENEQDRKAIENALQKTGVTAFASRSLSTLSGGEKQRARIAAALAQQTEILILDEPTTHLDIKHQLELLRLLKALAEDGLTVITVLHDINLAALFCDDIVLLSSGNVIRTGAPQDVLTSEQIEAVYDCKVTVYPHPVYQVPQIALLKGTS